MTRAPLSILAIVDKAVRNGGIVPLCDSLLSLSDDPCEISPAFKQRKAFWYMPDARGRVLPVLAARLPGVLSSTARGLRSSREASDHMRNTIGVNSAREKTGPLKMP